MSGSCPKVGSGVELQPKFGQVRPRGGHLLARIWNRAPKPRAQSRARAVPHSDALLRSSAKGEQALRSRAGPPILGVETDPSSEALDPTLACWRVAPSEADQCVQPELGADICCTDRPKHRARMRAPRRRRRRRALRCQYAPRSWRRVLAQRRPRVARPRVARLLRRVATLIDAPRSASRADGPIRLPLAHHLRVRLCHAAAGRF